MELRGVSRGSKAAIGFEPMNNGFAIRPLEPLGYAAGILRHCIAQCCTMPGPQRSWAAALPTLLPLDGLASSRSALPMGAADCAHGNWTITRNRGVSIAGL